MPITIKDVRAELMKRPHRVPAVVLLDAMAKKAEKDELYASRLSQWLAGEYSTVFLRDTLCEPLRLLPEVIKAGAHFNPTTNWDNLWMPVDSVGYELRQRAEFVGEYAHLPTYGMF